MDEKEKKRKTREQLWDSLLEVYEKEAGKENVSDYEEVSVVELENWTINHPHTSFRALPQLVELNPRLVSKALPAETAQLTLYNEMEEEPGGNKKKRRHEISPCKFIKKRPKLSKLILKENTSIKKDATRKLRRTLKEKRTNRQFCNLFDQSMKNRLRKNNISNKIVIKTNNYPEHKCDLKLRYFSETGKPTVRSDGRTFKCQLIFKVCECLESDIVF